LERMGISAVIIEDKKGLKKNSLFGTDAGQNQDSIEDFCAKITAGKNAQKTRDFMIIARCESLILEQGMEDALTRCDAYVKAGADGIMIHSRKKTPDEVYAFCEAFRAAHPSTPIVVVPTTYNAVTEEELAAHGVNVVIHANHLIRSAFPAMQKTAQTILTHGRSQEADALCMSIKAILTLLPNH
ncbi:MAG: isocitrate lyase/phosphoenolpyruvate mutase family protein, partial [Aristaeellaceae bacterium]